MSKFDVIIIGSGLGGLQCGFLLSKKGYRVGIFERGTQLGGCLQVFRRKGYTFDSGMHYVGSLGEGEMLNKMLKFYELLPDLSLSKLDEEGFERIHLQGKIYPYAMGYDRFQEALLPFFPKENEGLKRYVDSIMKVAESSPMYNLRPLEGFNLIESDYVKKSVGEAISACTSNPLLQNVLAGINPLYAGYADRTPFYVHALVMHSYLKSAWRIVGGSHKIAESLVNSIRRFGGEVYAQKEVVKIDCDSEKAVAIQTTDGERYEAKYFISDIHPAKTVALLDTKIIRNAYRHRIMSMENTISHFTLYMGFKPQTVPYLNYNYYHYNDDTVWNMQNYRADNWPRNYLFMHQARSEKDVFADSAQLIAFMSFDEVRKWENTSVGKRGADYEAFKQDKMERVLQQLERDFPGIRDKIAFCEASTPLTYRDYTGSKEGSLYGILRDCHFPAQTLVSQRTKLPNLFLTGQNVNAHGFLGVSIGAMITCGEFLGINNIIQEIKTK